MNLQPHAIVYIIIFFCATALFLLAWPRRKTYGGNFFVLHLVGLAIWDIGLLIEAENKIIVNKIFWSQFSYIGLVFVTPLLYLFLVAYTTQEKVNLRTIIVLMIIPVIVLVGAWTNNHHHLLWTWFAWGAIQYNILSYGHGILFYVNIIYIYFLVAFGMALLIRAIPRNQPPFRSQLIAILIAFIFPIITGFMYVFNIEPVRGMDISIFGFLMTNIILAFGFIHYRLLDLVPVANDNVVQHLQDGMIVVDWRRRIVKINQNAIDLLALSGGAFIGKDLCDILPREIDLDRLLSNRTPYDLTLKKPKTRYLDLRSAPLAANATNSPGSLLILRDVTQQKEAEINLSKANRDLKIQLKKINGLQEQLRDQALHDPLTGLFNFRGMDEILDDLLEKCKRENQTFCLIVMDIDHFKRVNDVFGHQTGNYLLQEYGKFIRSSIRKDDFACRFGGDEILLSFLGMPQEIALAKAEEIRLGIKNIKIENHQSKIFTSVSIGIAFYPENGSTIKELISAADQAMYEAKEKGRDAIVKATMKPISQW
jgi:diguanylate cyclase (GGDEF)-like protein